MRGGLSITGLSRPRVRKAMGRATAFIIAFVVFGAFFLGVDILLFGAQGLSFLFRG